MSFIGGRHIQICHYDGKKQILLVGSKYKNIKEYFEHYADGTKWLLPIGVSIDVHNKISGKALDVCEFDPSDPNHAISQNVIAIFENMPSKSANIKLKADKDLFSLYCTIPAGTEYDIRYIKEEILRQINVERAKIGLLVDVFDEPLQSSLEQIIEIIRHNSGVVKKEIDFMVSEAPSPIEFVAPRLEVMLEKTSEDGYIKVEAQQSFLRSHKFTQAKSATNLAGRFFPKTSQVASDLRFSFNTEDVVEIEQERFYEYKALKSGHIFIDEQNLSIEYSDELNIQKLRTKTELEYSRIVVGSGEDLPAEDAVGSIKIVADSVRVKGSIGRNGDVAGNVVTVAHQQRDAVVSAKKITIDVCKGNLFAEEVKIKKAETGSRVFGKRIVVEDYALSAKIRCDYCAIKETRGCCEIIATKIISIDKAADGIYVIVDGLTAEEYARKKELNLTLSSHEKNVAMKKATLKSLENYFSMNSDSISKTLENIKTAKAKGYASTSLDQKNYALIVQKQKNIQSLSAELEQLKRKIEHLQTSIELLETEQASATIIFGGWIEISGLTPQVKFVIEGREYLFKGDGKYRKFYFDLKQKKIIGERFE